MSAPGAPPLTLVDLLADLGRRGRRPALGVCNEIGVRVLSAAELHACAARIAACLHARGLRPGERVALRARASPEWVAAFLALAAGGATAVLLDRDLPREHALALARGVACRALLHDGDDGATDGLESWPLAALARGDDQVAAAPAVAVSADDPAAVIFTSGTTGAPRGVVLTHANLLAPLRPFRFWRPLLRGLPLRLLVLPPPSHALGLVVGTLLPLDLGLVALHAPAFDVADCVRLVRGHRVAMALLVPRLLEQLRRALLASRRPGQAMLEERLRGSGPLRSAALVAWHRAKLLGHNRFRLLLVGGAALPRETEDFWRRSGVWLVQGYGLAETAALATVGTPFDAGRVGRALGGVELRLSAAGEVCVRGPGVSPGALGPDGAFEPAPFDADGFLPTGDLGRLDARGRLLLLGRLKEVIVTAEGHDVAPDEVEAALRRQAGVRECAAVARDAPHGEEVHAVLIVEAGADPAAIVRAANAELPEFARVRGFSLWPGDDLPRGALGKPRRVEVRRLVQARAPLAAAADAAPPLPSTLEAILAEPERGRRLAALARLLATDSETLRDARLGLRDALGLSSLDVVELLARVEHARGAPCPTPRLRPEASLADVAAALAAPVDALPARLPLRQPWWARGPALRLLRPASRTLALGLWRALHADVRACWHAADPRDLDPPLLVAASPHRHWLDALALACALPPGVRRRALCVTNHDFGPWFDPRAGTPWRERLASLAGYAVGLPLLFEFAILTPDARAREGLHEIARALDRGLCPLTFPHGLRFGPPQPQAPGVALLARATGRALLPAHIEAAGPPGVRPRRPRARIVVHFAAPLAPRADETRDELMARLDKSLAALARAAPHCN